MLRCLSGLIGYRVAAIDGRIGKVRDFVFEDARWTLRQVIVESNLVRNHGRSFIASDLVGHPDWSEQVLPVALTVQDVKRLSEDLDEALMYRRSRAIASGTWLSPYSLPLAVSAVPIPAPAPVCELDIERRRLHRMEHVIGYRIRARDGEIGRVYDFVVDDEQWFIAYIAVATGKWLPGRKVLVGPEWASAISSDAREVAVSLSRDQVKKCPEYDPLEPVNRECEVRYYDYSGRPTDW